MLPLLPDQIKLFLLPDQLIVLHQNDKFWKPALSLKLFSCDSSEHVPNWKSVVLLLEDVLKEMKPKTRVEVLLSNHFVRYQLMPSDTRLGSYDEELAYVKFNFRETYGEIANDWKFSWGPGFNIEPQVVSAIDGELFDQLSAFVLKHGGRLHSVQPYLMRVFNGLNTAYHCKSFRFMMVEDGRFCSGVLNNGVWTSLRSIKFEGDWQSNLELLVKRELLLLDEVPGFPDLLLCLPKKISLNFLPTAPIQLIEINQAKLLLNHFPLRKIEDGASL